MHARVARSEVRGDDDAFLWAPDEERLETANVRRLMRIAGVESPAEIRSRALDHDWFWPAVLADLELQLSEPFTDVVDLARGPEWARWFPGARLNLATSCVDRWAASRPMDEAIVWESERGEVRRLDWSELKSLTARVAHGLRAIGVGPCDRVGVFMPMAPETVALLYACARLGALAVPMFSGFGSEAVARRLRDGGVGVLICADGFPRGGKVVPMREIAEASVAEIGGECNLVIWRRLRRPWPPGSAALDWEDLIDVPGPAPESVQLDAEHPFLLAYTSGTGGSPKGAILPQGGLLAATAKDAAYHVDLNARDTLAWVTDIGWIMGAWSVLAAGSLGARLCLLEGSPSYPTPMRIWDLVQREGVTVLGLSPSLVRGLIVGTGAEQLPRLSSLRTIAASGEPMTATPYRWLAGVVGRDRCPIINLSGGTEVGAAFLAPLPIEALKASSLGGPALGMDVALVDDHGAPVSADEVGHLVCRGPWPSMTRGLWGDRNAYLDSYWSRFPGVWVHGDWARFDRDGQWFVEGRSDDALNAAGQRIAPTEIEDVLVEMQGVLEAAAVPVGHSIKGQEIWCFVVLSSVEHEIDDELMGEAIAARVGKPFRPARVIAVTNLPRTRSGKLMRGLIRQLADGGEPTDASAIHDQTAIDAILEGMRSSQITSGRCR